MFMMRKIALLIIASMAFIATSMAAETSMGSRLVHRKHLFQGSCKKEDISVAQSRDDTEGIPKYRVEIVNNCVSGCAPSRIHFHCGWFSSANLINPGVFRRLEYDDCLVNNGQPLKNGAILSFYYSTTYMYPLSLKSASFFC